MVIIESDEFTLEDLVEQSPQGVSEASLISTWRTDNIAFPGSAHAITYLESQYGLHALYFLGLHIKKVTIKDIIKAKR